MNQQQSKARSIYYDHIVFGERLAAHQARGRRDFLDGLLGHNAPTGSQVAEPRLAANHFLRDGANVLSAQNVLLPVVGGVARVLRRVVRIDGQVQIDHVLQLTNVGKGFGYFLVYDGLDHGLLVEEIAQLASTDLVLTNAQNSYWTL